MVVIPELGRISEFRKGRKHFIIAANLGYDRSIKALKHLHKKGLVTKEDFAARLFVHIRLLWMQQEAQSGRQQQKFVPRKLINFSH